MRIERSRLCAHALLIVMVLCLGGCQGSQAGTKRWGAGPYGQGSVDRQKNRAVIFDPYPLNDIGPPVIGGRPHGFMNPLPEAKRNQLTEKGPWEGYSR